MTTDSPDWDELFARLPIPVSVVDAHGRQVMANQAYADFLGYHLDEVVDLDVGRVTRLEDQQWTRTYFRRLVSGEMREFTTEKIYVRKDGSEVVGRLTSRGIPDADGVCQHVIGTITEIGDTGDRIDTRLSRLLGFTGDYLTVVDAAGDVIESTGMYAEVLGYPSKFWNGRNIAELVAPEDLIELAALRDRVLADPGAEVSTEIEVLAADGEARTLVVRAVNCLADPEVKGIVLVTRDVTSYRMRVAELTRRSDDAESVVDAQTRLLATVSHELRNPLHAVRGIAELLASEDLPPGATELANSLVRQVSGLAQVTQDLLDAARLDAGKVAIETAPTDLAALVDDVVQLGRAAANGRELDVTFRVAHDTPSWVMADGNRLRQVLGNLVGNAVKFTEQGSVQLVARPGETGHVVFSVIDTGAGIPPEDQSRVLEPFAVASNSGEQRGAGLGLSIVQRLVAAMGGRVTLTSTLGEGTRFDVSLPLAVASPPESADAGALPVGLRILVVEDNPVNQQLATSQLKRLGLEPVIAGTGEDGLDLLVADDAVRFDAVLMDHQLPGISGTETTQRIRALAGPIADIPIIGLSASASAADHASFVAAGMDDFLPKPASLDDLSGAIARAVRGETGRVRAEEPSEPTAVSDADGDEPAAEVNTAIDSVELERLADDLGDPDTVVALIDTFLGELDGRVSAIVSAGDDAAARRAAHSLKSSSRLLGAERLAETCEQIEHGEPHEGDVAALAELVRAELTAWRSSRAAS